MDRAKKLKSQETVQLGVLVQVTGADALPVEALAGALLTAAWRHRGLRAFEADKKVSAA